MPLNMSPDAQALFYEKVFGKTSSEYQIVQKLIEQGCVFETSMYTCKMVKNGHTFQVSLSHGTTSLMKNTVPQMYAALNKKKISEWLSGLSSTFTVPQVPVAPPEVSPVIENAGKVSVYLMNFIPGDKIMVIKVVREANGMTLKEAKDLVEAAQHGTPGKVIDCTPVEANILEQKIIKYGGVSFLAPVGSEVVQQITHTPPPMVQPQAPVAKPVAQTIQLRDALAVGQKVKGTSSGSVYHCVALNDKVRLAARILKHGSISVRAEWTGKLTKEETDKLITLGLSVKGDYASMHLSADGVPPERVLGAIILGAGLKWKQSVTSAEDLVVE